MTSILIVIGGTSLAVAPILIVLGGATFGVTVAAGIGLNLIADAVAGSLSSVLRAERRNVGYAFVEGGRALLTTALLFLSAWWSMGWLMQVGAVLVLRALCSGLIVALVIGSGWVSLRRAQRGQTIVMLTYGLPIFCAQLLTIVATNADRYVVGFVGLTPSDLTTYVAHARLAGILNVLLVAPVNLWYPIEAMRRDTVKDQNFFFGVFIATATAFAAIIPAVQISAPWFWPLIFPTVAYDPLLMWCIIGSVGFQALAVVWNTGALRPGHTRWNLLPPMVAGAVLLMAGIPLGQTLGLKGIAASRLAAVAVSALVILMISQRITRVGMPIHRLAPVMIGVSFGAGMALYPLDLGTKWVIFVVILICLTLGGIWNRSYLRALMAPPTLLGCV